MERSARKRGGVMKGKWETYEITQVPSFPFICINKTFAADRKSVV